LILAQSSPDPPLVPSQFLGPLGALVLALVVLWLVWRAFSTGALRVGKQVDAQLEQDRRECEQQITECKKERDWWRGVALEALGVGERLARQRFGGGPDGP
jgi:uncharacterized membrane protein YccC